MDINKFHIVIKNIQLKRKISYNYKLDYNKIELYGNLDNVYWFKYGNYKYYIKDKLKDRIFNVNEFLITKIILANDFIFNIDGFYKALQIFFSSDINKYEFLFPALKQETKDFYIFDWVYGTIIKDRYQWNEIKELYVYNLKKFYKLSPNCELRPDARVTGNYILTESGELKFVNLVAFVLAKHRPLIAQFENNTDTKIEILDVGDLNNIKILYKGDQDDYCQK